MSTGFVPAGLVRLGDQAEIVLHAGEVRLGREGQQVAGPRVAGRHAGPQHAAHRRAVDAQLGRGHRHVADPRAAPPGELTDAVDRVVVVHGKREPAAGRERVGLADQPQRRAGVGGEHAQVLLPRGAEEVADRLPGLLDQLRRGQRGRVIRVRVAQHPVVQQRGVRLDLAVRVQPAAGVVEVHVAGAVQAAVLGPPQPGERAVRVESGIPAEEGRLGRRRASQFVAGCLSTHTAMSVLLPTARGVWRCPPPRCRVIPGPCASVASTVSGLR
jgi:hypothetical protein